MDCRMKIVHSSKNHLQSYKQRKKKKLREKCKFIALEREWDRRTHPQAPIIFNTLIILSSLIKWILYFKLLWLDDRDASVIDKQRASDVCCL